MSGLDELWYIIGGIVIFLCCFLCLLLALIRRSYRLHRKTAQQLRTAADELKEFKQMHEVLVGSRTEFESATDKLNKNMERSNNISSIQSLHPSKSKSKNLSRHEISNEQTPIPQDIRNMQNNNNIPAQWPMIPLPNSVNDIEIQNQVPPHSIQQPLHPMKNTYKKRETTPELDVTINQIEEEVFLSFILMIC